MIRLRLTIFAGAAVAWLTACSSDTAPNEGNVPRATDALTCSSHDWCTTLDVKAFDGPVPAPAGGAIADGLYRLAYVVNDGLNVGDFTSDAADALSIRGDQILFLSNSIGTFTIAGATMNVALASLCSEGQPMALNSGSGAIHSYSYDYSFQGGELFLYNRYEAPVGATRMRVYFPVREELCASVDDYPSQPGADSFSCHVANCGCSEAHGTPLESSSCDFNL